jgi:hypothetical protein
MIIRSYLKSSAQLSLISVAEGFIAKAGTTSEEVSAGEGRAAVGFEFDAEQGSYVLEPYED